jgi:hypothetical protein
MPWTRALPGRKPVSRATSAKPMNPRRARSQPCARVSQQLQTNLPTSNPPASGTISAA